MTDATPAHAPLFRDIFADGSLQEYIAANIHDPWRNTPFKGYVAMATRQKGTFGEMFVSKLFKKHGHTVERAHSTTAGYDRLINRKKVEIKFSLACRKAGGTKKNCFIINHVSKEKDWERLVFVGINEKEEDICILWFTRQAFKDVICALFFNHQQGGKDIHNDDYICTKIQKLREHPDVHEGLSNW